MKANNDTICFKEARKRRVAQEISDALRESGMSHKEFAAAMHRQSSEVTKWLSGKHNFTCDLMEEISIVLGCVISGTRDEVTCLQGPSSLVEGYECVDSDNSGVLNDIGGVYTLGDIGLSGNIVRNLSRKATKCGLTLREYIIQVLSEKSDEKECGAGEFCGVWTDDYPLADEIRSFRTHNKIPEL